MAVTMCSTYKQTDPENEDYAPEHGAVRTFQAERLAELEAERLKREREEEEANNPMKVSGLYSKMMLVTVCCAVRACMCVCVVHAYVCTILCMLL